MARGKYKAKKMRSNTVQQKVEEVVVSVQKSSSAAEDLANILARYNKADKKGKKKLQGQLDKARRAAKAAAVAVTNAATEASEYDISKQHEEAIIALEEQIKGIDWNGSDPEDFWNYSDSARTWARQHTDMDMWEGIGEDELF